MAKCDEGYICQVCGGEVKSITQSDLYLRFVIGMVDPETLHLQPERHIRCNPSLAQFIDAPQFAEINAGPGFAKQELDQEYVRNQTELVTRGYQRLREVQASELPIQEYPLQEFIKKYAD